MKERKVGQTWRWRNDPDVYHCVLLEYVHFDVARQEEIWRILELDTERAGHVSKAYIRTDHDYGKHSDWTLIG